MMGSSRLAHKANTAPLKSGAYRGTNETVEHTKRQWLALSPLINHRQSKVARIRSLSRNTCVLQGGQVDNVQILPTSSPISPQKVLFYTRRGQNIVKNPKFGLFFVFPGARLSACTIPHGPFRGGVGWAPLTLHCDLEAGYGGGMGSKVGLLRAGIEPRPSSLWSFGLFLLTHFIVRRSKISPKLSYGACALAPLANV